MEIRPIAAKDREPLAELLGRIDTFSPPEVSCALELIDLALTSNKSDYQVLVATKGNKVVGYICYGPTPMTVGTFDLYWIASAPEVRGQGVGSALVAAMEGYGPTRGFYEAMQYKEEARFRDFYKVGEDLIILSKRL